MCVFLALLINGLLTFVPDTRIMLMFLLDPSVRPLPQDLKLWVDLVRWIKRGAPGGALSFFTYMELTIWVVSFLFLRFARLRWSLFVLFGWGVYGK